MMAFGIDGNSLLLRRAAANRNVANWEAPLSECVKHHLHWLLGKKGRDQNCGGGEIEGMR